jgi:hypothetical protein
VALKRHCICRQDKRFEEEWQAQNSGGKKLFNRFARNSFVFFALRKSAVIN